MSVKKITAKIEGADMEHVLELGEDGYYQAIIPTPPAPEKELVEYRSYPVEIEAEDVAGNITQDKSNGLLVKEDISILVKHWETADYFNAADYNRIKYNICYLKKMSDILFGSVEFENMGADKIWEEHPKTEEFKKMERNLNYIAQAAAFDPDPYRMYLPNHPFLDDLELNQMEEACQKLFDRLYAILKARKRLPYQLGKRGIL